MFNSQKSFVSPPQSSATHSALADYGDTLQECLVLCQDPKTEGLAMQKYQQLRDSLLSEYANTQVVELLDVLWTTNLSSQRSATMWQHMCHTEQQLTDQMAASHVQLHQNYLRLIQEQ